MCGIAGISRGDRAEGVKMEKSLSHRGPDFGGVWNDNSFTLSHRLLAIRSNAERSRQPWTKEDSPWVLVFNGQLYNTKSIKHELGAEYEKEELDTALLFALVEKKGWDFIEYIEGMFAIALYQKESCELRLYRDSSGQKPLYYTDGLPDFAFASEIKAILAVVPVPRVTDTAAVEVALSIGYIPGEKTLFAHIKKLRPREVLTRTKEGRVTTSYFTSRTTIPLETDATQALQDSIFEHFASKQKIAINLSGGMDSSLLLHEMRNAGFELHSYTTRFENAGEQFNDDATLAKKLAIDYGTTHHEISITSEIYRNNLKRAALLIEEPDYNVSLATYLEVATIEGIHGEENRVILSGDGGDELFGGYDAYRSALRYHRLMQTYSPLALNAYKFFREGQWWNYADPLEYWLRSKFFFFNGARRSESVLRYLAENLPPEWGSRTKDPVRDMMLLDRTFWLPAENFTRSDKLYMSESIELRSPLAYEPLRRYFDQKLTTRDYFEGARNKNTLRALYRGKLPTYITERKQKTGWRSPIRLWWNEEYKNLFREAIAEAPRGGIVPWDTIEQSLNAQTVWPGKYFHLYFSLALLGKKYGLSL